MKLLKILILFLLFSYNAFPQLGREFWFAVPNITEGSKANFYPDNGAPLNLHITALYETKVRLSKPADPSFEPYEFFLNDMEHLKLELSKLFNDISEIETYSNGAKTPYNNGFLLESTPGEVSVYFEWDNNYNREIMPLKGKNALGKDFWLNMQDYWPTDSLNINALSSFTIVATEDNTNVTIERESLLFYFPTDSSSINLSLNKGQSFSFWQFALNGSDIHNIRITSTEKIAVTIVDDALNVDNNCGVDMIADQLVPIGNIGSEYFIKKGLFESPEFVYITAATNGTSFDFNSTNHTLDSGEFKRIELTTDSAYISSNNPVYVKQVTGIRCEPATALLPSIENCVGSYKTIYTRGFNNLDVCHFRLISRNNKPLNTVAESFFVINGIDTTNIPFGYFEYSHDSAFIYLKDNLEIHGYISGLVPPGNSIKIYNSVSRFQFGVLSGNKATGAKYGFFSDYTNSEPSAGIGGFSYIRDTSSCNLSPIRFAANGGENYAWTGVSDPAIIKYLSNDSIADPMFDPDTGGVYIFNVEITGACGSKDIQIQANSFPTPQAVFSVTPQEVCSPDSILIQNLSDVSNTSRQLWTFEPTTDTLIQVSDSFYYAFPPNVSDTLQKYSVVLHAYSPGDYCKNSSSPQEIIVKPEINTGFTASIDQGCSPLTINFEDTTLTAHDSIGLRWNFDNGSQSFDSMPSIEFTNISPSSKIFNVRLVSETPYGCLDTAFLPVTVYPKVEAIFGVDTNFSCSPLVATFDPNASINADSLFWYIDYFNGDSTYFTDKQTPITITHYDTSVHAGPDTLNIQLIAKNSDGCVDTSSNPQLIVYPNILADFTVDKDTICDSDSIVFTNLSDGYNPRFEWDFGNNSYAQDSSYASYTRSFFNRASDTSIHYTIRLRAISGNFCSSTADTTITVHPYIVADFGFDYDNQCTPLLATISNTSIGVDSYLWDLGDSLSTSDTSFTYIYNNPFVDRDTTYIVKLVGTNNEGCSDSTEKTLLLFPEVIAGFELSDSSICSHTSIDFINKSTGDNLEFAWDFGDNQTGADTNFTKYYENNAPYDTVYDISLIVRNSIGCSDTAIGAVEVLANIKSFFDLPETKNCSPFTIYPENLSTPSAKYFEWYIDTATYIATTPSIPAFTNVTNFADTVPVILAALGANDPEHWACSDTHQIDILVYPELRAAFDLDTAIGCQPLITGFTNTTEPGIETTYRWYINGDYYSNEPVPDPLNIANNTDKDSTHTIWMYGNSKYGCKDTTSHPVTVYALVDANFTINRIGMCAYDSVHVDRSSSRGELSTLTWDFHGDIFNSFKNTFKYSFNDHSGSTPEDRIIWLTVENSHGCRDSVADSLLLYPTVIAGYTVDSTKACYPHNTIFTDTSINATKWNWTFGDGLSSTEEKPEHTYSNHSSFNDSLYTVQLIAQSDYNCYDTVSGNITIYAKPKANFKFPVTIDCPPFDVTMINESKGGNTLRYLWEYGKNTSTVEDPEFTLTNDTTIIEEQEVFLTVTSVHGCSDTISRKARVYPNLKAEITTTDDTLGCSPLTVQFGIKDSTNIQQMLWYKDGKLFNSITNPTLRFLNFDKNNNTHTIQVIAYSINNCVDTAEIPVTVFPTPIVNFSASPVPVAYDYTKDQTIIDFANLTGLQDNWSYDWDFGDMTTNQQTEPAASFSHIYGDHFWGAKDNYFKVPVTLKAWNTNNSECRDSLTKEIIINPPLPQVDIFEDISGCVPLTVDFSTTTKYIYDSSHVWEFGYGLPTSNETDPTYTYTEPGQYSVTLTIEGDAGKMSDYKLITVYPKPTVDFSFNDTIVSRVIDSVNFYNHSKNATAYYWYFDSEDIFSGNYSSTDTAPSWVYDEPGLYYPALIAKSTEECYDTLIHEVGIQVFEIGEVKFPTAFLVIPGQPQEEYATSQVDKGNRYLFYPKHESVDEYHLEIFNRWGSKIFESFDVEKGWNGFIENILAQQGIYVWRCRGRFINGQAFDISGDVTLLHTRTGI